MILFIISSFIIWRTLLFLASYFGSLILTYQPRFPYTDVYLAPSGLPSWIWTFANFDGVHYLTIASHSYSAQFTQVFFPVFPFLLFLVQKIFFFLPPLVIALSFSNLIFLSSLFILYKLLKFDYDKKIIKWIIIFTFIFPTSFYFGSLYTEGLFLLFTLSSFYFARKEKWILASVFAALSSATRFLGIFIIPALIWELIKNKHNIKDRILKVFTSPVIYIAPLGLIAYMVYLHINFGDALYFWHAQPAFGAQRQGSGIILLPQVLWRYFKILTSVPYTQISFWIPLTELLATLGGIILLILARHQKIRSSYLIYAWPSLLLPSLTGTLSSMPRYILIIFPLFISLGLLNSKRLKIFFLVMFLTVLVIFTVLFTRGLWIA